MNKDYCSHQIKKNNIFLGNPFEDEILNKVADSSLSILIADDLAALKDNIIVWLQSDGHHVEGTQNGKEALEKIKENPQLFNVLITDYEMPVMNGGELLLELLKLPDHAFKLIILMSGMNPDDSKIKVILDAYQGKALAFHPKPISLSDISQQIASLKKSF